MVFADILRAICLREIIQNTRKPQGILGEMVLKGMNTGHAKLAAWGGASDSAKR